MAPRTWRSSRLLVQPLGQFFRDVAGAVVGQQSGFVLDMDLVATVPDAVKSGHLQRVWIGLVPRQNFIVVHGFQAMT